MSNKKKKLYNILQYDLYFIEIFMLIIKTTFINKELELIKI